MKGKVFLITIILCCIFGISASYAAPNNIPLTVKGNVASVYIDNAIFKPNSAAIKPQYNARLDAIAAFLRTRPHMSAIIHGHYSANQTLSQQRNHNIKTYLVKRRVKPKNITIKELTNGYSFTRLQVTTAPAPMNTGPNVISFKPVTSSDYIPHVYLYGFAGSSVLGMGDILQPIILRSDRNFFAYGHGDYSYSNEDWASNPWTGSFALGYRQIVGNAAILGAYVFGDYVRTTTNHSIWLVSPGIEALGRVWEFHANGYIPVSKRDWSTTGFASDFGNYDYIHFSGHNQFDAKFRFHEQTGPGADAELGRTLFKCHNTLVTGFVYGYYFHVRHNTDVRGGGAAIAVQPNTYLELSVNGSYDNYAHTVVMVGVQLSLYDLFSSDSKVLNEQDLQRRLFDPIRRDFANLAFGSDVRMTGGPRDGENHIEPEPEILGHHFLQRTNIWFFDGTGAWVDPNLQDGTYEHPYARADFNQPTVKHIYDTTLASGAYPNAYLYFNGASYDTFDGSGNYVHLEVFPGESLWGRMGDCKGFQMPATGANRPTFFGGLQLDSNTSLNNLLLQNNAMTGFTNGIIMDGVSNVSINDSVIGVDGAGGSYQTGLFMQNGSSLTISGSEIYGYDAASNAAGIEVQNGGNVNAVNNSIIKGRSVMGDGTGLYVVQNASGDAVMGNISGDGTATFIGEGNKGYGLNADSNGANDTTTIGNISDSKFIGTGTAMSYGLFADADGAGSSIQIGNISNSDFAGTNGNKSYGFYAMTSGNGSSIYIGDISAKSNFKGSGGVQGYGFYAENGIGTPVGTVQIDNISDSTFTGIGTTKGEGFYARAGTSLTIASITTSSFSASDIGINLNETPPPSGTVTVAGTLYTTGATLFTNYLQPNGNNFIAPAGNWVCVKGACA